MHTFKQFKLSHELIHALIQLNYVAPTDVQRQVIPLALAKQDLIVKAKTGSGKTAAFGIPLCEHIQWEENKPQALILTPTRELAAQVRDELINIGRYKRIKATALYGKQSFERQKLDLKQKTHIVVGTPGRVLDHLKKGTLPLSSLKYLILDEADEMLNMGFIEQVEEIIKGLPTNRVTSLYSATFSEEIIKLSQLYMNNPVQILIANTNEQAGHIEHYLLHLREEDKNKYLLDLTVVENPASCIIFCSTHEQADYVYRLLDKADYPCGKLHGGLTQEHRFKVMDDFKKGLFSYLVATNVAARGIDIEDISLIINYAYPIEPASYVHRTGRTGRAGKSGKAITFVTASEEQYIPELEEYLGFSIKAISPPSPEMVIQAKPKFLQKLKAKPVLKADRAASLNKNIMKLYFNGGKKKKLRAVDFVGTISKIPGITAEDIGIIKIEESATFIDILNGKGPTVLQAMRHTAVKGKQLKVHEAR